MENSTIDFLWKASEKCAEIRSAKSVSDAMRIHLRRRCIEEHTTNSFSLPKTTFGANRMCIGCHSSWSEGRYRLRLIGETPLTRRTKATVINREPAELNRCRRKLRELCTRPRKNVLELECLVCLKVTRMALTKPEVRAPPQEEEEDGPRPIEESPAPNRKNKRKKRDSFAGLNASAVQSARQELGTPALGTNPKKKFCVRGSLNSSPAMNRTTAAEATTPKTTRRLESPSALRLLANINSNLWTDQVQTLDSSSSGNSAKKKNKKKKKNDEKNQRNA